MTPTAATDSILDSTTQLVAERLCDAVDLRAGQQVLDVACASGNAAIAAARHWCDVTAIDLNPELLEIAKHRASGEQLNISFREADPESLPFEDNCFDTVLSAFGIMFTPNPQQAAAEMIRVAKPTASIALATWNPDSFMGQLHALIHQNNNFNDAFAGHEVKTNTQTFHLRYRSPEHFFEIFRNYYGPLTHAFATLDPSEHPALQTSILNLIATHNRAGEDSVIIPSDYTETIVTLAQQAESPVAMQPVSATAPLDAIPEEPRQPEPEAQQVL